MDLISAAASGDTVAVRKLLAQRDADPNTRGLVQATATTASHFAALHPALINSLAPPLTGRRDTLDGSSAHGASGCSASFALSSRCRRQRHRQEGAVCQLPHIDSRSLLSDR